MGIQASVDQVCVSYLIRGNEPYSLEEGWDEYVIEFHVIMICHDVSSSHV